MSRANVKPISITKSNSEATLKRQNPKNALNTTQKAQTSTAGRSKSKDLIKKPNTKTAVKKGTKSKTTKKEPPTLNVDAVSRLIKSSQDLVNEQNTLLDTYSNLSMKVSSYDHELGRASTSSEDFNPLFEKYSVNLDSIVQTLRNNSEESERVKCKFLNLTVKLSRNRTET